MNTYITNKLFNPGKLSYDLGNVALNVDGPNKDGIITIYSELLDNVLETAIQAHIFESNWIDPTPIPVSEKTQKYNTALAKLAALGFTTDDLAALGL